MLFSHSHHHHRICPKYNEDGEKAIKWIESLGTCVYGKRAAVSWCLGNYFVMKEFNSI